MRVSPTQGATPSTAPKAVATPFPPLKFRKTEWRCPTIDARATSRIADSWWNSRVPIHPTSHPFPMSPTNVRIPAFFPPTRKTLVNPTFRLPASLGSGEPNHRDTTTPKGIDPKRYPPILAKNTNQIKELSPDAIRNILRID